MYWLIYQSKFDKYIGRLVINGQLITFRWSPDTWTTVSQCLDGQLILLSRHQLHVSVGWGTVNFKQVTSCLSTKYWPTVDQFIDCLLIEVTYIKYDSNILGSKYALPLPLDFAPGLTIQMFFVPSMSIWGRYSFI